jgi:hypothetical protein
LSEALTVVPRAAVAPGPEIPTQSAQVIQPRIIPNVLPAQNDLSVPQGAPQKALPLPQDSRISPLVFLFVLGGVGWISWRIASYIRRRRRYTEEVAHREAEVAHRRQNLIERFGERVALQIIAGLLWEEMTAEQLIESWGRPVEVDRQVTRAKIRETWKYNKTGKNRFKNRIKLENGVVVEWTE